MVQRILSMLSQYLISNQSLQLDESFNIYLKILSIHHLAVKAREQKKQSKKRTRQFYQNIKNKHFGSRIKKIGKYNYFWAVDIPNHFYDEPYLNCFDKKCLIICTILNKKFVQIDENIFSTSKEKQKCAGHMLLKEIENVITNTNLSQICPYPLEETCKILSSVYNCQFIVFNGLVNSSKLL